MNRIIFISLVITGTVFIGCVNISKHYRPQTIKASEIFYHVTTKIEFPMKLDNFNRTGITSFNKEKTNISAQYRNDNDITKFTIYIYPAGLGYDDRLYDEYINSLQSIAIVQDREINAEQYAFPFSQDSYSFIGISATINEPIKEKFSRLILFECGEYFLKYRITVDYKNVDDLDSLQKILLEKFRPSNIVKKFPLVPRSNIKVAPAALADSLILYSTLAGAFKKSEWALNNVDSLESCSGFPGMYLDGHMETILAMTTAWLNNPEGFKRYPNTYFDSFVKLVESDYLDEFLMDQYSMVLYVSKSIEFEFDNYYLWKEKILPDFNFNSRYFTINYRN